MAKIYRVGIEEKLYRSYLVKAESAEQAEELIHKKYCDEGEIVLDYHDYIDGEIEVNPYGDEVIDGREIDFDATEEEV